MSLNKLQQKAYDRVIKDKAPITYLTGIPGAGKSHTVSQIINSVPSILTASTHKAKTVLSQMTGQQSFTVHKYFGFRLANINYKQVLVQKGKFEPKSTTLLVIDEISMCPDKILQTAIDGVGKYYDQLLLVGDALQLPAVTNKPNLKALEKYKIELTEQMRQSDCSTLADYFTSYRNAITTGDIPSLHTDADSVTLIDDHKEFCREYLKCVGQKKIVAYRNNVVDKYNQTLVEGNDFNIGDTVIIDKPIPSIYAHNQDILTIKDIAETEDYYRITLISDKGMEATVRHYKLVSVLQEKLDTLQKQEDETRYWELFEKAFKLKHIYATTVHKCQGDSIEYVFVDALDIINAYQATKTRYNNPISKDMFLRLMYVALSRMKGHCYIFTGNKDGVRYYDELTKDPNRKLRKTKPKPEPTPKETERWTL